MRPLVPRCSKTEGCLHGQAAKNLCSCFIVDMQIVRPLVQTIRFTHRLQPECMMSEAIGCTILMTSHLDPALKPTAPLFSCLRVDVKAAFGFWSLFRITLWHPQSAYYVCRTGPVFAALPLQSLVQFLMLALAAAWSCGMELSIQYTH